MWKGLYFLCTLLCCKVSISQTTEESKFVLFRGSEYESKRLVRNPKSILLGEYIFSIYDNAKASIVGSVMFTASKYKDFDEKEKENPIPFFKVNKRFIKNNRDEIITLKKMQDMGLEKSLDFFRDTKHIFLIDATEIQDKKVVIREVFLTHIGEE